MKRIRGGESNPGCSALLLSLLTLVCGCSVLLLALLTLVCLYMTGYLPN